ncbi:MULTISPECIES: sugar transferase [Ramlibacter]|uniref:Sugar transferase n=1 Tax=Ramlibacter pinisoli TaxID=2682844 RepID=A0A6N8IQJ3_9BURK|nr:MULTISPECIES: sugar transferase [Ramlibacter]MBA2964151.1 sugar transferase [Ramlibacter sp. CGMCC 1.13660]MVQ29117.1 sugar transferase [Ramlibacter pinisoli]
MKRLFDILGALAALVVLSPILLLAAAAVALESGSPVLFRQQRVGLGGHTFQMLKFRSMVRDAARIGPWFTSGDDPRITRVGRFLRRSSIDELPQLLNVLRGDMSLVGPRPDVPAQQALYRPEDWALRCSVRPGITGLAQATMRSEATPEQRLAADLAYASNPGLASDLRILVLTLGRLTGKGSN